MLKEIIDENLKNLNKEFKPRDAYTKAKSLMKLPQIISLIGVRRCGKSTILKELVKDSLKKTSKNNVLYLNLEHPYFNQFKDDVSFLKKIYDEFKETVELKKPIFIFLDEIQFFRDWQVFIKYLYEKKEAKIIITGSNSRLLSSELATLLSGRSIPVYVYPFSFSEAKVKISDYLKIGGFPEILKNPDQMKILIETYYKNILYQDVIPRFGVNNTRAIENLSYYLISNIGKEISYNNLKELVHVDDKTVKQYTSYLEDANLLYEVSNYDSSLKKQIGNKKKVYVVDPAFTQLGFSISPNTGRLMENAVFMELKKAGKDIYFLKNGKECDFIVKEGLEITLAIQVCYELNKDNLTRELEGFPTKFTTKKKIIVTYSGKEKVEDTSIEVMSLIDFIKKIRNGFREI